VVPEGHNIELYRDSRTTSANLADHLWSSEQTLGITDMVCLFFIRNEIAGHGKKRHPCISAFCELEHTFVEVKSIVCPTNFIFPLIYDDRMREVHQFDLNAPAEDLHPLVVTLFYEKMKCIIK